MNKEGDFGLGAKIILIILIILAMGVALLLLNSKGYYNVVYGNYVSNISFDGKNAIVSLSDGIDSLDETNMSIVFYLGEIEYIYVLLNTNKIQRIDMDSLGISNPKKISKVELRVGGSVVESVTFEKSKSPFVKVYPIPSTEGSSSSGGGSGGGSKTPIPVTPACVPMTCAANYSGFCGASLSDGCSGTLNCSTNCDGISVCNASYVCEVDLSEALGFRESITQYGVTWYFDKELTTNGYPGTYQYGTFANGDFWVKTDAVNGKVNVTRITPDYDEYIFRTTDACLYEYDVENCTMWNTQKYSFDLTDDYQLSCDLYAGHSGYCTYKKAKHGFMVNINNTETQGLDARVYSFNESLVPSLPYIASSNQSIVKVVSFIQWVRPRLENASVLTILGEVPPNNGATIFRPGYFGAIKKLYSTEDIQWGLLPTLAPVSGLPAIELFRKPYSSGDNAAFNGVQLDYINSHVIDYLHPATNMPNDGGALATRNGAIALRLMFNDSIEDKRNLTIDYIQQGIDFYYAGVGGTRWRPDGQIMIGRKLPMTFAAVMLNDNDIKSFVMNGNDQQFQENGVFQPGVNTVLWWMNKSTYASNPPSYYWPELINMPLDGGKTGPDPYFYIDGSSTPGVTYLTSGNAMQSKKFALAIRLMPSLASVWNDDELLTFADRWTYHGIWAQPDPCAPPTGVCKAGTLRAGQNCTLANSYLCNYNEVPAVYGSDFLDDCDYPALRTQDYGVKYGHNASSGTCILDTNSTDGIGRLPLAHGQIANTGQGKITWTETMWNTYRGEACYNDVCGVGENSVNCPYDCP